MVKSKKWVHGLGKLKFNDAGEPIRMIGTIQDVTARKKAEKDIAESKQQYMHLFESMIEGCALHEIICDASGKPVDYRFLAINPAFEKLTGMKAKDFIGKRAYEEIPGLESFWV